LKRDGTTKQKNKIRRRTGTVHVYNRFKELAYIYIYIFKLVQGEKVWEWGELERKEIGRDFQGRKREGNGYIKDINI